MTLGVRVVPAVPEISGTRHGLMALRFQTLRLSRPRRWSNALLEDQVFPMQTRVPESKA